MRDIRFRAWREDNEEMINNITFVDFERRRVEYMTSKKSIYSNVHFNILMQGTGLKDKNGKEIYEGDIVKEIQTMKETLFEIRYIPKKLAFCYVEHISEKYKDTKIKRIKTWEFEPSSCIEVVGNIYENEELLNEEVK